MMAQILNILVVMQTLNASLKVGNVSLRKMQIEYSLDKTLAEWATVHKKNTFSSSTYLTRGKSLATIKTFQWKTKHVNIRDDVLTGDTEFTSRERFKVESFLVVIDKLTGLISFHMDAYAYAEVCRLFSGERARAKKKELFDCEGGEITEEEVQLLHQRE